MDELVVRHTYAQGMAWDVSKWRNHGRLRNAMPGSGSFKNSMRFIHPPSAVIIRRSDSLKRIDAVRVRARIYTEPLGGGGQRMNIIEGHLSFAFFVNPNFSLQCTFLNPAGSWVGVTSAPNTIRPFTWYEVEFRYDGISVMEQFVNGVMTAGGYDLRGLVRGVGPHGIYVGHWPEPADQYTFRGYITDVEVWRREPRKNLKNVMNQCCIDERAWFRRLREFREQGYDRQYLNHLQDDLLKMEEEFLLKMRGDSEKGVEAERKMIRKLSNMIRQRDYFGLSSMLPDLIDWVHSRYEKDELIDFGNRAHAWAEKLPATPEAIEEMARDACLGELIDTVKGAAEREAIRRKNLE